MMNTGTQTQVRGNSGHEVGTRHQVGTSRWTITRWRGLIGILLRGQKGGRPERRLGNQGRLRLKSQVFNGRGVGSNELQAAPRPSEVRRRVPRREHMATEVVWGVKRGTKHTGTRMWKVLPPTRESGLPSTTGNRKAPQNWTWSTKSCTLERHCGNRRKTETWASEEASKVRGTRPVQGNL